MASRADVAAILPGSAAARATPAAKPAANAAEMVSGDCVGSGTPPVGAERDAGRVSQALVLSEMAGAAIVWAWLVFLGGDEGREGGVRSERCCCRGGVVWVIAIGREKRTVLSKSSSSSSRLKWLV